MSVWMAWAPLAGSRHHVAMSVPLTRVAGMTRLSDGQIVTLLVGVSMALSDMHAKGRCHGSLHPVHVELDHDGRPLLRSAQAPDGWTSQDDVLAVLRLGTSLCSEGGNLAESLRGYARDHLGTEGLSVRAILPWLLKLAPPKPLLVPGPSWGRCPARSRVLTRWSGPET